RPKPTKRRSKPRRLALGTLMTVIFFAGAAFTAGAGNEVAAKLDSSEASAPAQAPAAADPSAADAQPAAAPDSAPAADPAVAPGQRVVRASAKKRAASAARRASAAQEAAESPNLAPVVWLNRVLPDPTPPSRRLDASFAKRLSLVARRAHVDWALMLGVLRAEGASSSVPATPRELRDLAAQLAAFSGGDDWNAALAVTGRTSTADQ